MIDIPKICKGCGRTEQSKGKVILLWQGSYFLCPECVNAKKGVSKELLICSGCGKQIHDVNQAVFNPDTKKPYHYRCADNIKPGSPRTGRAQIGGRSYRRGAEERGLRSWADAQDFLAGFPDPGENGPSRV